MTTTFQLNDFALWTALVTPFTDTLDIDYQALASLVDAQANAGNGILICGSTGEGLAIEPEQQYEIVKFVCGRKPNVPLMVAVGGSNINQQVSWIEQCNSLPIHSFLLTSPLYTKPGAVGQSQWFKRLLDSAKHPCMLYNVPSRTGSRIPVETVKTLADHDNFWAMKEASGDINEFLSYVKAAPKIKMYSGEDALLPFLVSAGAVGLVSVCSNAWPQATQLYVQRALAGAGIDLFPVWYDAIASLFEVANPIPVKVLMYKQGVIANPDLRAPLSHHELSSDIHILAADKAINQWFSEQTR